MLLQPGPLDVLLSATAGKTLHHPKACRPRAAMSANAGKLGGSAAEAAT